VTYFPIRSKSQTSNIGHDGTLSFNFFLLIVKKYINFNVEPSLSLPTAIIRQKSQNFSIGHDGTLMIENFMLMIKQVTIKNRIIIIIFGSS
jgi:hypothetical protein